MHIGNKSVPPIPVTVVDDGPRAENLLHPRDFFSGDAQNHVYELSEAKNLLHHRTHRHVAGVLLREAHRDGFRQRHFELER